MYLSKNFDVTSNLLVPEANLTTFGLRYFLYYTYGNALEFTVWYLLKLCCDAETSNLGPCPDPDPELGQKREHETNPVAEKLAGFVSS